METKYGKYLVTESKGKDIGAFPRWVTYGARNFEGAEFSMRLYYLAEPYLMIKEAHSHDLDQFYLICGAEFANPWASRGNRALPGERGGKTHYYCADGGACPQGHDSRPVEL